MIDIIKNIGLLEEFKSDKIYYLYKTSSSEINLQILSHLQKYESSSDFFNCYTKTDVKRLTNSVNKLDKDLTSVLNNDSNNFSSNIDKYISEISKVILTLNLIHQIQEILNNLLLKSKQHLNGVSNNCKITNLYQGKLLSLINNLEYNLDSGSDTSLPNFSLPENKISSCPDLNFFNFKKQIEINENYNQEQFLLNKQLSLINEGCLSDIETPAFCEISKKYSNKDFIQKNTKISNNKSSNNKEYDNDLNLSFRDMKFLPMSQSKTEDHSPTQNETKNKHKKGKSHRKKSFFFTENTELKNSLISHRLSGNITEHLHKDHKEVKMYRDFLILINNLYKNCLITAEEKIEIKKLIISKSKKIKNFYNNEFGNIKDNDDKIVTALKNLL